MRKVLLLVLLLCLSVFSGCIVSSSPSNFHITMDKGDSLEFTAAVFPPTNRVQWKLQYLGIEIDTATWLSYMFTPQFRGLYQMTLYEMGSDGYGYNRIWFINVQ